MRSFKFPKAMGLCADRLYYIRQKRLDMQKEVDLIAEEESALKTHIINSLPKSEASGVAGKLARVTIITKEIPRVENWDEFYKYVKKTGQFDLMQRRVSDAAIKARWEDGKKVPGVEVFNTVSVSINKI